MGRRALPNLWWLPGSCKLAAPSEFPVSGCAVNHASVVEAVVALVSIEGLIVLSRESLRFVMVSKGIS